MVTESSFKETLESISGVSCASINETDDGYTIKLYLKGGASKQQVKEAVNEKAGLYFSHSYSHQRDTGQQQDVLVYYTPSF